MDCLDLGFEALVGKVADSHDNIPTLRNKWFCDWIILEYLQDVTPVCDANMFRLYADKYNIDIEQNTEEDLVELATMYRKQMVLFVVDAIKDRVCSIIKNWSNAVELPGCASICKLPAKCRKSMLNLLMLINNTTGTDLNPVYTQFTAELFEATLAKTTFTYDRADTYEILTKDQFQTFIQAVSPFINKCFETNSDRDFEYGLFQTGFKQTIRLVKAIMLMCMPTYETSINPTGVLDVHSMFDRLVKYSAINSIDDEVLAQISLLKGLDISHAICIDETNLNLLRVDSESLPETDAYQLIMTTVYNNSLDNTKE